MSGTTTPTSEHTPTAGELVSAWRALRHGGLDESTTDLAIPPTITAFLPTLISSVRWGTVLFGMVYAAPLAARGDLAVVGSVALMLFLTSWRSYRPLKLGSRRGLDRVLPLTDVTLAGIAIGLSAGFASPFAAAAIMLPALAAFGWGPSEAALGIVSLIAGSAVGRLVVHHHHLFGAGPWWITVAMVVLTLLVLLARRLCLAAEVRRAALSGRLEILTDANDLLSVLARVARTLPNAYNLHDALERVRVQLTETFDPRSMLLVSPTGEDSVWRTEISDGIEIPLLVTTAGLPTALRSIVAGGAQVGAIAGSPEMLATPLSARGAVVGLLMITADADHPYSERHQRLLLGLSDVLALTIDNGRLFGRLRSFGAEAERTRIARDLHDRLGQWLTYIGLELERIVRRGAGPMSDDIDHLRGDVQSAMGELRETLRDLRTTISPERGFEVVAAEVLDRFHERTGVITEIDITTPGGRLDIETEHELLRILQEALHNVDKHAAASEVDVSWSVSEVGGRLVVIDNGRGFDERDPLVGSYGLVGMRERAVGIGATLEIQSRPGAGTTLVVETIMEGGK